VLLSNQYETILYELIIAIVELESPDLEIRAFLEKEHTL